MVAEADVWMGSEMKVGLVPAEDIEMLVPVLASGKVNAEVVYNTPIEAPVAKGDQLGEMIISLEGLPEKTVPLVADRDVAAGGFMSRVTTAAKVLLKQWGAPVPGLAS